MNGFRVRSGELLSRQSISEGKARGYFPLFRFFLGVAGRCGILQRQMRCLWEPRFTIPVSARCHVAVMQEVNSQGRIMALFAPSLMSLYNVVIIQAYDSSIGYNSAALQGPNDLSSHKATNPLKHAVP